jgi:hypothetical protein
MSRHTSTAAPPPTPFPTPRPPSVAAMVNFDDELFLEIRDDELRELDFSFSESLKVEDDLSFPSHLHSSGLMLI